MRKLLSLLFRLPFLPVEGVIRLGEILEAEAERRLHDPARIRRELDEAQRRYEAGEVSEEEFAQIQDELAGTLVTRTAVPVTRPSDDRS